VNTFTVSCPSDFGAAGGVGDGFDFELCAEEETDKKKIRVRQKTANRDRRKAWFTSGKFMSADV
jgi:hypothetical protein